MVEASHAKLSIVRQYKLLNISRSGVYYKPVGESAFNLAVMAEIDRASSQTGLGVRLSGFAGLLRRHQAGGGV